MNVWYSGTDNPAPKPGGEGSLGGRKVDIEHARTEWNTHACQRHRHRKTSIALDDAGVDLESNDEEEKTETDIRSKR